MRKVDLNMEENNKYLTIKKLVETNGNKSLMDLNWSRTTKKIPLH